MDLRGFFALGQRIGFGIHTMPQQEDRVGIRDFAVTGKVCVFLQWEQLGVQGVPDQIDGIFTGRFVIAVKISGNRE